MMAFAVRNLSVLAYANGFTLWHYKAAAEDHKTVGNTGYFAGSDDVLSAGDMIMVSAGDGGRLMCLVPEGRGLRAAQLG